MAEQKEIKLKGIAASPGICIGMAYLVDLEGVDVVKKYEIAPNQLPAEIKRFKMAVQQAGNELQAIIDETPEKLRDHARILETHNLLLKDKMFFGRCIDTIEKERVNCEWALKKVVAQLKATFRAMDNSYLRDRVTDVSQVADRVMNNLVGASPTDIAEIVKRVLLVAKDLSPAQTSQIKLDRIQGFVTDRGGKTSHTSIIARALKLPAVLGLENATTIIQPDDLLVIDGNNGWVIVNPSESTLVEYEERMERYEARLAAMIRDSQRPALTEDGIRLPVMGNIELPEEVVSGLDHGADGIGLYRTEFQYLSRPNFPQEDELYDRYRDVVEVLNGLPVSFRTLDINGDKALRGKEAEEVNPALGLRAIRYCLKKPSIFQTQLRAILRAAAHGPVRIIFPMITVFEELTQAIEHLDLAAESLEKEGVAYNRDIEVGVMIEVPAAAVMADVLAEKVDFFSIGTNDLLQYSLAMDRGNRDVAYLYDPLHPANLRMLRSVCQAASDRGIPTYMCGEMASEPTYLPILLGLGLAELSMAPTSIPAVKNLARKLSVAQARDFVASMTAQTTASRVTQALYAAFGELFAEMEIETGQPTS